MEVISSINWFILKEREIQNKLTLNSLIREFPGGPVVRTLLLSLPMVRELKSHKPRGQKKFF